jgi:predicted ester cyclase
MKNLFLSLPLFLFSILLISCRQNMTTDNSATNKAAMLKIFETLENGNVDALDNYIAEDAVNHGMDTMTTQKRGLAAVKEIFNMYHEWFSDINITVNAMGTSGDTLLAYYTFTGTNTGPMMGMPATNKPVSVDGVDIVVFKDGKAVEHWGVEDRLGMMQQLGMMPGSEEEME